jgi:transcription initiation factor TFIID subunit TAF12
MKSSDVPQLKENFMAEAKKTEQQQAEQRAEQQRADQAQQAEQRRTEQQQADQRADQPKSATKTRRTGLIPAAEASDPEVHRLLAERQVHMSNAAVEPPDVAESRKAAQARVDEIDDQLADLGYSAK